MFYLKSHISSTSLPITIVLLYMSASSAYSAKKANSIACPGIFITWQDYKTRNIIAVEEIKLNHLFSGHYIEVVKNGKDIRYNKDSIFGYEDEKGRDYRFYKIYNDEYQILENLDMVIYVTYSPTHAPKGVSQPMMPYFYFSKSVNTEIIPLTLPNLINAFPENHNFHHELEDEFKKGRPLSTYDEANKMFRVNYLLNLSKTKSE